MEIALAVVSLIVILLAAVLIVVGIRCTQYKDAYLFYVEATSRICEASNTFDESLAIMSAVYKLPEKEVIRRLMAEDESKKHDVER